MSAGLSIAVPAATTLWVFLDNDLSIRLRGCGRCAVESVSSGVAMSTNPLHLSDILAGPPNDADYEAIYAEIVTTERGRRFLTEYAIRARQPDTHMLIGTIARLEAAMRDDLPLQVPATFARDLTELAAAIERVEAEIAASGTPAPDGLPAAERIQDIALALRDLARRADAMIALVAAVAGPGVEPLAVDPAVAPTAAQPEAAIEDEAAGEDAFDRGTPPPAELSEPEARQDENFAQAVGALAALFPALAEAGEPEHEPPSAPADMTASSSEHDEERASPSREPIIDSLHEVAADVVVPEHLEPVAASTLEPSSIESSSIEPFASDPAGSEWIEPAAVEREQAAEPAADVSSTVLGAEDVADHAARTAAAPVIDIPAPTDAEAKAAADARMTASEAEERHSEYAGDAGGLTEPAKGTHSSEGISIEMLSNEVPSREELPSPDFRSEELPSSELPSEDLSIGELPSEELPSSELPSEELSSGEVAGEASSIEPSFTEPFVGGPGGSERIEPAGIAAAQPAGDEIRGHDAERFADSAQESATDAVDTHSFDEDDVGSQLQLEPVHLLLPDTPPPTGPEEDPADLFEPLPLPIPRPPFTSPAEAMGAAVAPATAIDGAVKSEDSKQTMPDSNIGDADRELTDVHGLPLITVSRGREEGREEAARASASEGAAASQVFSAESPASAFAAAPSMQAKMEAKMEAMPPAAPTLPPPRVSAGPATRAIPRVAPSDPLAAVHALSEEELIALFS